MNKNSGGQEGEGTQNCDNSVPQASSLACGPSCLVLGSAALQRQIEGNSGKSNVSNEGAWGINLPEKIKGAKSMQLC